MPKRIEREHIHTVTRLGTVSIPMSLRRKYNISKGSRIRFVDTKEGIKLIPLISLKTLFGTYRDRIQSINDLIREIIDER